MSHFWISITVIIAVVLFLILKATSNLLSMLSDLMEVSIHQGRRYYNDAVKNFKQAIVVFPVNIITSIFGFNTELFFEEERGSKALPKVSFS